MRRTDERVVFITGASRDTVEAIAPELGRAGATVVLGARTPNRLQATVDQIEAAGGTARAHPLDVTSRPDVAAFAAAAIADLDREEPTWQDAEWQ